MCRYCRNLKEIKDSEIAILIGSIESWKRHNAKQEKLLRMCLTRLDASKDIALIAEISALLRKVVI